MLSKHVPHRYSKEHEDHLEEIGDYMTSPVFNVDSESFVKEAAQIMQSKHIGSLFVKEGDKFVGIITENDLSRKVVADNLDPATTKVSEIMTAPILTLDCIEHVEKANQLMAQNKIRHMGVTKKDEIIGILSVRDLVAYFANPRIRTW
ncbi:MAG: CBS domain-containing protein [Nitrospinae bacterium]|nr:CBS domain-containing protein [Nitrospinota bacterium]